VHPKVTGCTAKILQTSVLPTCVKSTRVSAAPPQRAFQIRSVRSGTIVHMRRRAEFDDDLDSPSG
jgi:hypothetical protein